jgi:RNA polymerase-binding transcription factor DksA
MIFMADLSELLQLNQRQSSLFHQHKKWLKQVLNGEVVKCQECGKPLKLEKNKEKLILRCEALCTDVELEH